MNIHLTLKKIVTIMIVLCSIGLCNAGWEFNNPTPQSSPTNSTPSWVTEDGGKWKYRLTVAKDNDPVYIVAKAEVIQNTKDPGNYYGALASRESWSKVKLLKEWTSGGTPSPVNFEVRWTCESSGVASGKTDGWWRTHKSQSTHFTYSSLSSNIRPTTDKNWSTASNSYINLQLKDPEPADNTSVTDAIEVSDKTVGAIAANNGWGPEVSAAAMTAVSYIAKTFQDNHTVIREAPSTDTEISDILATTPTVLTEMSYGCQTSPKYVEVLVKSKVRMDFGGSSSWADNNDAEVYGEAISETTTLELNHYSS
ncbi:MAG: hypothetical protein JXA96_02925 [Sedimentisphaerales bacterium]|nr:hypothetical protein [Sedimentisphaerales bacterium]